MTQQPWYKQFWPWFLIILPACAVSASIYTYYVAATSPFSMVSEDYYKEGKGINQDLSRIRAAQNMGLSFSLQITDGEIVIEQHGGAPLPGAIELEFHHATLEQRDFVQMLTKDGNGRYRLRRTDSLDGTWLVQIDAFDQSWRLQTRITLPNPDPIWLK
ncbi:FixH family protein [Ferrimonas pelagia]|uniref:FixH family protein n=1 Tax=Ferrimonas pelagia TaxID=1177826 RepID=A0ABP9EU61_9GAMM